MLSLKMVGTEPDSPPAGDGVTKTLTRNVGTLTPRVGAGEDALVLRGSVVE